MKRSLTELREEMRAVARGERKAPPVKPLTPEALARRIAREQLREHRRIAGSPLKARDQAERPSGAKDESDAE